MVDLNRDEEEEFAVATKRLKSNPLVAAFRVVSRLNKLNDILQSMTIDIDSGNQSTS